MRLHLQASRYLKPDRLETRARYIEIFCGHQFLVVVVSMKSIPIGIDYAAWAGIDAVGIAILGMIFLGESRDIMIIICLLSIVA